MAVRQKISTHLCFVDQAEEAVNFYLSIFKDGKILNKTYVSQGEAFGTPGAVRTITFELFRQKFWAVNGGEHFKFTDAMSLYFSCETQEEIDYYWEKLSESGNKDVCGWLTDKFGVSWQISANIIDDMVNDPDPKKSERVVHAIFEMKKLNIEILKKVYEEV